MRTLRELGNKIVRLRKERERLEQETKFISHDLVLMIVEKAATILFNTPVPTEIPTDSFAEDYDPDFVKQMEEDLKLESIDVINTSNIQKDSDDRSRSRSRSPQKKKKFDRRSKNKKKKKDFDALSGSG